MALTVGIGVQGVYEVRRRSGRCEMMQWMKGLNVIRCEGKGVQARVVSRKKVVKWK